MSLARLPGIGKIRAQTITSYRENHSGRQPVYQNPDDLLKIKGIGPKTVDDIKYYLVFD
jgi:competence ComEA-like helix-hairpin-helix protein